MALFKAVNLRITILFLAAMLMLGVFALDYRAGRGFDLWLLYVVPLGLVSVVLGPRYGYATALVATALLFLSGYLLGNPYDSTIAFVLDRGSEGIAYLLFAFLIGVARTVLAGPDSAPHNQPRTRQE